jgi:hypothetical protein
VTPHRVPEQSSSHAGLLDESPKLHSPTPFDAILVPTCRKPSKLSHAISLARRTDIPLIIVCSKSARRDEVIDMASRADIEAVAVDLATANPLGITFRTSTDSELVAASPGWARDLSTKRNLGLLLARMLGWQRLMFLDDDIYRVTTDKVAGLAAALDDHNISALIPKQFPDNSVVCHAHRLGGGKQDVFASASGIGVRCDRDYVAFFPNIYNEDWFFFAEEAAHHRIAKVGESRQLKYDPYEDPLRAAQEEFGDLLAEGLYARLDINMDIRGVSASYWRSFIERRRAFHARAAAALNNCADPALAAKAGASIRAAQQQLGLITPALCQRFIERWQWDLTQWRRRLATLPPAQSVPGALEQLELKPAICHPSSR